MVGVPLGIGAYKRSFAGMPEVQLVNRYVEKSPTNQRERVTLIGRPGYGTLSTFSGGTIRGCYTKPGFMGSDLFVVSGNNLWRYSPDGLKTQITGYLFGTDSSPYFAWMKGIGYEYLFVCDGSRLQYYSGGTFATGTLTLTPSSPPDISTQVLKIGSTYYSWNNSVDTSSPDGTSSHPWLSKKGATDALSLVAMANLINFGGVPGTDFSTNLPGPRTDVVATCPTSTTLKLTATRPYTDANAIATTVFSGARLAWGGTTMSGGGTHALASVATPDGVAVKALTNTSGYVLVSVANSQKFFWIEPGAVTIDALNFAEKESQPDAIIDMLSVGDQALLIGNACTENWYATGDSTAPFAPVEGRVYQRGAVDGTAERVGDQVILVGNDGVVYAIGYQAGQDSQWGVHRISNPGIEERVRTQLRREQGLS